MKTIRIDNFEICTNDRKYDRETDSFQEYEVKNGEMMCIYMDFYAKYFKVVGIDYDPYDENDDRQAVVNVTFNEDRSEGYINVGIEIESETDDMIWHTLYIKALSGLIDRTRIYEVIVVDYAD